MKQKKIFIFCIIILIVMITIVYFAISANAENTGGTVGERKDEKTLVRMTTMNSKGRSSDNKVDISILAEELDKYAGTGATTVTEQSSETILITFVATGNAYEINVNTGPLFDNLTWVSPSVIFDAEHSDADALHIGDFVNYDAGTWTAEEIAAIQTGAIDSLVTANGSTSLPDTEFQFGGFTEGSSRNANATIPSNGNYTYNYVQDASTGKAIAGWRLFDIEDDGKVVLISAGNSEDYFHSWQGYASEYILTGNINSAWSTIEASNYQKRNWADYINTDQKAESATPLSTDSLNNWLSKYIGSTDFSLIYNQSYIKYKNLIDNGARYWLSTAAASGNHVYWVQIEDAIIHYGSGSASGVRILVTLSSNVLFTAEKTGTKTLNSDSQTYNCWDIQ